MQERVSSSVDEVAAVSVRGLTKSYKGDRKGEQKHALNGIDLDIPKGSFFGLLGANGAGKSTFINIMAGLTLKTAGQVVINGCNIDTHMRQSRLSLGVVPQELVLDTFFTVREALDIHAGYYGVPKTQRRTDEIIEAMGLQDKADVNARRLSGGMRRRLLIGKALVHNPAVLVLDEPTAGVDVELREQLWAYVRTLNEAGTTIVLTTHYLEEAEQLCDEIAVLHHGEVVAHESKQDLLGRLDSKRLIITLSESLQSIPDALSSYCSELDNGRLVVKYKPSQTNFEDILNRVKAAGLTIHDITTHEADLETVFRQLTAS